MTHFINNKTNITNFINSLPNNKKHIIYLEPGIYFEKVTITKDNITLIGSGYDQTIITFDDYSLKVHRDGLYHNTFRTSTFLLTGNNCIIKHLTIKNESGLGTYIDQAVALSVYGNNNIIDNCLLSSYQDTLFIGPLPSDLTKRYDHILIPEQLHYNLIEATFTNCFIEGHVDFIFGGGSANFIDCQIKTLKPGYVAAPSTHQDSPFGFVFYNCNFFGHHKYYLARPWRENSKAYFVNSKFCNNLNVPNFQSWDDNTFEYVIIPNLLESNNERLINYLKTRNIV